jgi:hypothetical protein
MGFSSLEPDVNWVLKQKTKLVNVLRPIQNGEFSVFTSSLRVQKWTKPGQSENALMYFLGLRLFYESVFRILTG